MVTELIFAAIILALILLISWREWVHVQQVDQLTNKIMSRDFQQYQASSNLKPKKAKAEEEKPKTYRDPTLGVTF